MKIGYDLDGVLCNISTVELDLMHAHDDKNIGLYYAERIPLLNPKLFMLPGDKAYCITSRVSHLHGITINWLDKYYPDIPVYFLEENIEWNETQKIARSKVQMMKRLEIEVYFDDSPDIIEEMRLITKDIKFIQYGGRLQ